MEDRPFEQVLAELRSKERAAITEAELEFLKARSSYLTEDEQAKFGLTTSEPEVEKPASSPVPPKAAKKGKQTSEPEAEIEQ